MNHEDQAAVFLGFWARYGGSWEDAYAEWAAGKDFSDLDRAAIRRIVRAELLATGDAVFTDPIEAA